MRRIFDVNRPCCEVGNVALNTMLPMNWWKKGDISKPSNFPSSDVVEAHSDRFVPSPS
jgi:hypothetical protein